MMEQNQQHTFLCGSVAHLVLKFFFCLYGYFTVVILCSLAFLTASLAQIYLCTTSPTCRSGGLLAVYVKLLSNYLNIKA
jgi:hypothetical protein